ncbi:lantibiotic dehydratase [Streptomyces sp. I05A-00742]|uniref:lantibiotic dehydratase n=1 Tax=Streptomyces sp. I05A-00742 TaxID=2732853 RepID=UPI0014880867|nr:lantibiotic dehydratase [Streptomyces sp. I05A-00742]
MTTDTPAAGSWRMSPVFVLRHTGMPFEWLEELGVPDAVVDAADRVLRTPEDTAARAEFVRSYGDARNRLRRMLRATAARPEFRAAVFLSNPGMYEGMLTGWLAREHVPDTSRFRRVERQAYLYLQRFCGKNETTSTFGPMGYGEVDDGTGLRVERVPVRRSVQLTRWALEELARAIGRDPGLRAHIPLRRSLLADDTLPEPPDGRPWPPEAPAVWRHLGAGAASLAALAAETGLPARALAGALRSLAAAGLVHRGLLFPAEDTDGLGGLGRALAALPAVPARTAWADELRDVARELAAFRDAGDAEDAAERRGVLLAALEKRFTALTGSAARRGAGQVYADRLLLFEEASSPFRIGVGAGLARRIEAAVAAGLDLSAAAGAQAQRAQREQAARLLRSAGRPLTFVVYAEAARPPGELRSAFGTGAEPLLVKPMATGGVAEIDLPVPADTGPLSRYALPDLCLLGSCPEEVAAGPRVVLARVHHHLLLRGWLTTFAEAPERFDRQVREWLEGCAEGRITRALATTRRNKGFYRFPGRRVAITPADHEGRPGLVPASRLWVGPGPDGLPRVTDESGEPVLLYPPLADLTAYPPLAALTPTPVLHRPVRRADGAEAPLGRVRVGGAVYQRASWTLPTAPLAGLRGADAFLAVRRLVSERRLPRWLFVRVGGERKPVLVDTRSPFAADVLCHLATGASASGESSCRAEEMLPGPGDLWLRDERGRYSCELRVQFLRGVDPSPADGGGTPEAPDGEHTPTTVRPLRPPPTAPSPEGPHE